jgi:hypothetical protein
MLEKVTVVAVVESVLLAMSVYVLAIVSPRYAFRMPYRVAVVLAFIVTAPEFKIVIEFIAEVLRHRFTELIIKPVPFWSAEVEPSKVLKVDPA